MSFGDMFVLKDLRFLGDTSRAVQAVLNNSVVSVANTLNGEPSSISSSSIPIDFLKHDQRSKLLTGMIYLFLNLFRYRSFQL